MNKTLKEETVMHVMSVGRVVHTVFVFTQKDDLYSSNCIETSIEELMSMPVDMYDVRIMFTDHTWSKLEKENNRYSWKHNSQV